MFTILFTDSDIDISAVGLDGELLAAAIDIANEMVAVCVGTPAIHDNCDGQLGGNFAEIGFEVYDQFRIGGQADVNAAEIGFDLVRARVERAAEFHRTAVRLDGQRYRLRVRNDDVAKI